MMTKHAPIVGLAALLFAAWTASEARAGVMVIEDMECSSSEAMAAAPADHNQSSESPDDTDAKLLPTQPAQGGAGASGSGTSLVSGSAPVALLATDLFQTTLEPIGFCMELENSQLPSPPASDLLRPPRHNG